MLQELYLLHMQEDFVFWEWESKIFLSSRKSGGWRGHPRSQWGSEPVGTDMVMTQLLMASLLKKTCAFQCSCACKSPPVALRWSFRMVLIASSRLVSMPSRSLKLIHTNFSKLICRWCRHPLYSQSLFSDFPLLFPCLQGWQQLLGLHCYK